MLCSQSSPKRDHLNPFVIPTKVGISCGSCPALLPEIPTFVGMTGEDGMTDWEAQHA